MNIDSSKSLASKVISGASYHLYILATFLPLLALTCFLVFYLRSLVRHFRLFLACSGLLVHSLSSSLYHFRLCFIFCHLSVFVCHLSVLVSYLPVDLFALLQIIILIRFMPLISLSIPPEI